MSREAAFSALFAAVSAAYPWGLASRRMKLWSEDPAALRPALFQLESGPETYQWANAGDAEAHAGGKAVSLFRRARSRDAGRDRDQRRARRARRGAGAEGADLALGRQTLGGAVHDCRITGVPVRDRRRPRRRRPRRGQRRLVAP